ncbi:hypothetical protein K437DRAFT_48029 [Tilletiaria anomala UBC 951]|uniref:Histone H1 n=1 Tax=Tilletiaria anomala (strain ATCC 24038 / CBS 436.72 / UBC 951) TaxID=1037660 RepID=A0A066VDR3_TILAU|nr:uncharacterized protein K437DRAFT_48029 [Tilletiaria anomala UBC 951]KDN36884.1 hypothetical protein K437DRAFT_48029 [Tilletiaria anomala UBC 951]
MIKEAILAHPEEARSGIGRPTIKKYIHQKHPQTVSMPAASFNNLISKAITKGEEKKIFVLPKGPSGKVKLAPKVKEVVKKPVVKKPVVKKPAVKKATPAKKPATAKKVSSATKPKKTTTSKKPAAKVSS